MEGDFEGHWARCRCWIEAALEHDGGGHTIDDVKAQILSGDAFFWPAAKSAMVGEIYRFPRKSVFNFWLAGGDMAELLEVIRPAAERWAVENGCTQFTIAGREGWQRVMARYGYAPRWRVCAKDI